ncbi:MAG: hypothetical protein ACI3ZD_15805 [Prevotella sp.]
MGSKKANDVFAKWRKTVKDNKDEKTVCFIDRGSWSDPQIAIYGKLLNYYDVESLLPENCNEPSDEDWICAAQDSYFGYTECDVELDDFQDSDALSVTRIINIK